MKYICLGYYDKGKFEGMSEGERNDLFDTCFEYDDHLRANGHWAGGEALQSQETALTLYGKNGKVATTDGPYAETKEQLGSILENYWVLNPAIRRLRIITLFQKVTPSTRPLLTWHDDIFEAIVGVATGHNGH